MNGPHRIQPYVQQAHKWLPVKENAMIDVDEIWGSEINLYHPKIYAGTTDPVGQYKGQSVIMDSNRLINLKERMG